MARQEIISGSPYPVYVNETGTRQEILAVVYINETSSSSATPNIMVIDQGVSASFHIVEMIGA